MRRLICEEKLFELYMYVLKLSSFQSTVPKNVDVDARNVDVLVFRNFFFFLIDSHLESILNLVCVNVIRLVYVDLSSYPEIVPLSALIACNARN